METSIAYLKEQFQLKDPDIRSYSPLTLAYIGDGIYELYIRTILIKQGNCQVNKLHKQASRLVKAQAQSEMVQVLEPHFTEEEEAVYKRGRNAKSYTTAKNATTGDYRRATGFEAVMGYLYLNSELIGSGEVSKLSLEEENMYAYVGINCYDRLFRSCYDEIHIWNSLLNENQISAMYAAYQKSAS